MFKKAGKMNRLDKTRALDRKIMKTILISERSIYSSEQTLKKQMKSNYTTVWRHIEKMQKDNLLTITKAPRKNGKPDKRGTKKPELTLKGLATLLIEGDLQKEELIEAGRKALQKDFRHLPEQFLREIDLEETFANIFLKMKPKVNLKFFDETYFSYTLAVSFIETVFEALTKTKRQRDAGNKARAEQMKRKYAQPLYVNGLRDIQRVSIAERDRFSHYVKLIDGFLGVLRE
jgi:hypothetical protein